MLQKLRSCCCHGAWWWDRSETNHIHYIPPNKPHLYFPAMQSVHEGEASAEYVPALQSVQIIAPVELYFPASHNVQVEEEVAAVAELLERAWD